VVYSYVQRKIEFQFFVLRVRVSKLMIIQPAVQRKFNHDFFTEANQDKENDTINYYDLLLCTVWAVRPKGKQRRDILSLCISKYSSKLFKV
jgi:hypothetical protein